MKYFVESVKAVNSVCYFKTPKFGLLTTEISYARPFKVKKISLSKLYITIK